MEAHTGPTPRCGWRPPLRSTPNPEAGPWDSIPFNGRSRYHTGAYFVTVLSCQRSRQVRGKRVIHRPVAHMHGITYCESSV